MLCPPCILMVKVLEDRLHEFLAEEDDYESDIVEETEHHHDIPSFKAATEGAACPICSLIDRDFAIPQVQGGTASSGTVFYASMFRRTADINIFLRFASDSGSGFSQITLSPLERDRSDSDDLLPPSTGDDSVMLQVKSWLTECVTTHQKCKHFSGASNILPNRLLDIKPEDLPDGFFRLIEDLGSLEKDIEYATISHRWGDWTDKPWLLNGHTRENLLRGQQTSMLPGTYRDAISTARRLGIRYFWVDSLCIAQDGTLDILREAHRMASIYSNGVINFAGLEARQDGFFSTRDPKRVSPKSMTIKADDYDLKSSYQIWDTNYMSVVYNAPISDRGWILQEQLLARRTVHFGQDQIFWSCLEKEFCETYPTSEPPYKSLAEDTRSMVGAKTVCILGMNPAAETLGRYQPAEQPIMGVYKDLDTFRLLNKQWWRLIEHYTPRKLTDPKDRLLAMAGLSEAYGKVLGDKLIEGHWIQNLPECLLWRTAAPMRSANEASNVTPIAPSWSWVSRYTAINGPAFHPVFRALARADSIDTQTLSYFDGEFTIVNATTLQLYGARLPVLRSSHNEESKISFLLPSAFKSLNGGLVSWPGFDNEIREEESAANVVIEPHFDITIDQSFKRPITALFIAYSPGSMAANSGKTILSGLILRLCGAQPGLLTQYERVGMFDLIIDDVAQAIKDNALVSLLSTWGFLDQQITYTSTFTYEVSPFDFESAGFMQTIEIV